VITSIFHNYTLAFSPETEPSSPIVFPLYNSVFNHLESLRKWLEKKQEVERVKNEVKKAACNEGLRIYSPPYAAGENTRKSGFSQRHQDPHSSVGQQRPLIILKITERILSLLKFDKTFILCSHPPKCVLFQRDVIKHPPFPDIRRDCLPIFPKLFSVTIGGMSVRRHQVTISPAFAPTEYKVLGCTYRKAVLDLSRQSQARLVFPRAS